MPDCSDLDVAITFIGQMVVVGCVLKNWGNGRQDFLNILVDIVIDLKKRFQCSLESISHACNLYMYGNLYGCELRTNTTIY